MGDILGIPYNAPTPGPWGGPRGGPWGRPQDQDTKRCAVVRPITYRSVTGGGAWRGAAEQGGCFQVPLDLGGINIAVDN